MRPRLPAAVAAALAATALATVAPATADTVRLRNGRAYEGVIAEEVPGGVRVRLAFGYLVLPHDQVVAVEKSPSALAEYLARKRALTADPATVAGDWLALARWSQANELVQGVRETALLAAQIDPWLAGLDPLLRPFGLVLDEDLGRWLPFEESMARRGLVRDEGEWITVAAQKERQAERERRRATLAQEEASRRMAAAAEAMERNERRREQERFVAGIYQPQAVLAFPVLAYPVVLPPMVIVPPAHPRAPGATGPRRGYDRFLHRAPGSLLPPPGESVVPPPPALSSSAKSSPAAGG
jgi:hypothetical protein